jgi:hypothetical protein
VVMSTDPARVGADVVVLQHGEIAQTRDEGVLECHNLVEIVERIARQAQHELIVHGS